MAPPLSVIDLCVVFEVAVVCRVVVCRATTSVAVGECGGSIGEALVVERVTIVVLRAGVVLTAAECD